MKAIGGRLKGLFKRETGPSYVRTVSVSEAERAWGWEAEEGKQGATVATEEAGAGPSHDGRPRRASRRLSTPPLPRSPKECGILRMHSKFLEFTAYTKERQWSLVPVNPERNGGSVLQRRQSWWVNMGAFPRLAVTTGVLIDGRRWDGSPFHVEVALNTCDVVGWESLSRETVPEEKEKISSERGMWSEGRRGSTVSVGQLGEAQCVAFCFGVKEVAGLTGVVEMALMDAFPFLALRVHLDNDGEEPLVVDHMVLVKANCSTTHPQAAGPAAESPLRRSSAGLRNGSGEDLGNKGEQSATGRDWQTGFFVNGWQSASFTGYCTKPPPQGRSESVSGDPISIPSHHVTPLNSSMFGALVTNHKDDPSLGKAIVAGFLAQRRQFGSVSASISDRGPNHRLDLHVYANGVHVLPGASLVTDWAIIQPVPSLQSHNVLGDYLRAVRIENGVKITDPCIPCGWHSGRHNRTLVSEQLFTDHTHQLSDAQKGLPLQIALLDGGWETNTARRFPSGLGALVGRVNELSFRPGVWLAPFATGSGSRLSKDHPDWIIRDENGVPVVYGQIGPDDEVCGLDSTHPGVQDYVRTLVTATKEWGFSFLVLDYLVCTSVRGRRYDKTKNGAQALRIALHLVRDIVGSGVLISAARCPLGPALGLVDCMRVGVDLVPMWRAGTQVALGGFSVSLSLTNDPTTPCLSNAIRNAIARSFMSGEWWVNDLDAITMEDRKHKLSEAEFRALLTVVAATGSSLFLTPESITRMPWVSQSQIHDVEVLFPLARCPLRVCDLFQDPFPEVLQQTHEGVEGDGPWNVVTLFNWSRARGTKRFPLSRLGLDPQVPHHILEFWSGTYRRSDPSDAALVVDNMAPHSCAHFFIRPIHARPQFIGSDLHISGGRELVRFAHSEGKVEFTIRIDRVAKGLVWLSLPRAADYVVVHPETLARAEGSGSSRVWKIMVSVEGVAGVVIAF